jgi:coenzyme F420-reducing hydrogenase delta subunit/Pyruvate/2-oxoacid:ferredoxin oxidoreductase delta subunit
MKQLTEKALLIGNGNSIRLIADELAARGIELVIVTSSESADGLPAAAENGNGAKPVSVYPGTRVLSCRGAVGHFEVVLDSRGIERKAAVGQVVIAGGEKRRPCFSSYGLRQGGPVMALSRLKKLLSEPSAESSRFSAASSVVFLDGLHAESNPIICEDIMRASLQLQENIKPKIYILTRNLKVGGSGLEAIYRKTRAVGVNYIKFTATTPQMTQLEDGRVKFEFTDEITGSRFGLTSDLTVIDEQILPDDDTVDLANRLGLDMDLKGFAQGDNVHRLTVFSNRNGILVAGPARNAQSLHDQRIDADNAILSLLATMRPADDQTVGTARINDAKCIRCLTCLRLCPHQAIEFDTRVSVTARACEKCGICAAECPRCAISIDDQKPPGDIAPADDSIRRSTDGSFIPSIAAFCCSRSAAGAAEMASCLGHPLPAGLQLIEVPCGGSVSLRHLFEALQRYADGVMVLTCHDGNCHSERGNLHARQRGDEMRRRLTTMGLEAERLVNKSLAANMGLEFAQALMAFEQQLLKMGPNRLKKEKT